MRRKMASIGTDRSPRRPDPVNRTITEGVIPDLELTERLPPTSLSLLSVVRSVVWGMKGRGWRLGSKGRVGSS